MAIFSNTHSRPTTEDDLRAVMADFLLGYVVSGGLHERNGFSTVGIIPPTRAYVLETNAPPRLFYVEENESRSVNYNLGSGTYWLIMDADVSGSLGGWTRVTGTHYLWMLSAEQPALPSRTIWLSRSTVVITGTSAITQVGDLRRDSPFHGEPVNVLSPLYGVREQNMAGLDCTEGIQMALNAASWQTRRMVKIPAAPSGQAYLFSRLWFNYDEVNNPGWNIGEGFQGRMIVEGDGHLNERDILQGVNFPGTVLLSTHPTGPAINVSESVFDTTNNQRLELRDIHFQADNTTCVARINGASHIFWDHVSFGNHNTTTGSGVEFIDCFQVYWDGGNVVGSGKLSLGTLVGIGVRVEQPNVNLSGFFHVLGVSSRDWRVCWQYGLPNVNPGNRFTDFVLDTCQGKGCHSGLLLFAELRSGTIKDCYFEEFRDRAIGIAGASRGISVVGGNIGGGQALPGTANLDVGLPASVTTVAKSARNILIQGVNFNNVETVGIRLQVINSDDNGREVSHCNFTGAGQPIEIFSSTTIQHQLRIHSNHYPETALTPVIAVPIPPDVTTGARPDFLGRNTWMETGRMMMRHIGLPPLTAPAATELVFQSSSNVQSVGVDDGSDITVDTLTFAETGLVRGTVIQLILRLGGGRIKFVEGGNLALAYAVPVFLQTVGSSVSFMYDGDDSFIQVGAHLDQRAKIAQVTVLLTDTEIVLPRRTSIYRITAEFVGQADIDDITQDLDELADGDEICFMVGSGNGEVRFTNAGNMKFDGGVAVSLQKVGSNVHFIHHNGNFYQSGQEMLMP